MNIKELNKCAVQYKSWKMKPENNKGTSEKAITYGMMWIYDFIDMVRDSQKEGN